MILRKDWETLKKKGTLTPPEAPVPAYDPIRAIRYPLQLLVMGVFGFFEKRKWLLYLIIGLIVLLLSWKFAFAGDTIFEDNFDNYLPLDLNTQGTWSCAPLFEMYVSGDTAQSLPYSIKNIDTTSVQCHKVGMLLFSGSVQFWFKTENCGSIGQAYIRLFDGADNYPYSYLGVGSSDTETCQVVFHFGGTPIYDLQPITYFNDWVLFKIWWDLHEDNFYYFQYQYADNPLSEWIKSDYNKFDAFPNGYSALNVLFQSNTPFYLDTIGNTIIPTTCADYHTLFRCAGSPILNCSWIFTSIPPDYGLCVEGEAVCGAWNSCDLCFTQLTCEAQEGCLWANGFCQMEAQICGTGGRLQFCGTSGECTTKGGYWYSNHCWASPPPTYFVPFDTYYAENGDYASPSAFILTLSGPADNLFSGLSGFVGNFSSSFAESLAYTNGKAYGSAIPKARSYLTALNSFAGNLPVGEAFIFIIIFMLAIGLFKALHKILAMIKFW